MRPTQEELEERNILKSKLFDIYSSKKLSLPSIDLNRISNMRTFFVHTFSYVRFPMFLEIFNFLERAIKPGGDKIRGIRYKSICRAKSCGGEEAKRRKEAVSASKAQLSTDG